MSTLVNSVGLLDRCAIDANDLENTLELEDRVDALGPIELTSGSHFADPERSWSIVNLASLAIFWRRRTVRCVSRLR